MYARTPAARFAARSLTRPLGVSTARRRRQRTVALFSLRSFRGRSPAHTQSPGERQRQRHAVVLPGPFAEQQHPNKNN